MPLFGTVQRKLIAGIGGLALIAGIAALGLKKHHDEVPQIPQGGGDTSQHQDKKPTGEVTVWPPAPADNAPTELKIVEFASDAKRVNAGQTAHLRWSVQGATEITITPEVGTVEAAGTKDVVVQRTTQFVLTAKKLGGDEVHQAVVVEAGTPAPEPARRLEVAFAAQPESLVAGQSTQLRWSVPGAQLVTIAPEVGRVPAAGSVTIKPARTTTYKLQARAGKGVTGEGEVTVQVQPQPQTEVFKPALKPEISFQATPNTIAPGGSTTLSWNLKNAFAASITPQPGTLRQTSGKVAVSPAATTTYVLTARTKDGVTETATAVVEVTAPTAPPGPARSSSAMITVVHDHGGAPNASAWPSCYGALQVMNGVLRYTVAGSVDGRMDGFEIPVSQIQEVKLNRVRIRNQPAFHIMLRGQHLNFVTTGMAVGQAVAEIEATIPRR